MSDVRRSTISPQPGTDVLPLHQHVTCLPRMQEEIDRLPGRQTVQLSESLGIDAHELAAVGRADEVSEQLGDGWNRRFWGHQGIFARVA